jgi:integrase
LAAPAESALPATGLNHLATRAIDVSGYGIDAALHHDRVRRESQQFFNHAVDRDLIERNRFTHLGASKRKRRVDRPDLQIVTDEQYERLRRCARESRADDYGLILEEATMTVGETAMRPGEIFGLHRPEVHMDARMIHVRRQLDLSAGEITWPKDDDGRWVPMSPALFAHFEAMPQMGKVGGAMSALRRRCSPPRPPPVRLMAVRPASALHASPPERRSMSSTSPSSARSRSR